MKFSIKSNFIIGLFAVLPIAILAFMFYFLYSFMYGIISPFIHFFNVNSLLYKNIILLVTIIFVVILIFILGLFTQTRIGLWLWKHLESVTLDKIPGYKAIRETVTQFKSTDEKAGAFSQVGFVDPYGSDALMLAFVTCDFEDRYSLFVPSSPNPTSGFLYHVKKEDFFLLKETKMEEGLKAVISCGIGAEKIQHELSLEIQNRKSQNADKHKNSPNREQL